MAKQKTVANPINAILTATSGSGFTPMQYASAFVSVSVAGDVLQARMAECLKGMDEAGQKVFRTQFYEAVKAECKEVGMPEDVATRKYNASKTLFSRAKDIAFPNRTKNAGNATKTAKETTAKVKPEVKLVPMSDEQIIVRVGTLGNTFIKDQADRAVFARCLTIISNGIKLATSSKK